MAKTGPVDPSEFNLDKITPEIAAKIVKHFVLPMFDNSAKSQVGKRLGHKQVQTGSIYTELKLSDQLNDTLADVRNEVTSLTNALDQEVLKNHRLSNDLKAFKYKFLTKQQEMSVLRKQLHQAVKELEKMREFVATMRENGDVMWQMANFNQTQRTRRDYELNQKLSEIEQYQNKVFELD